MRSPCCTRTVRASCAKQPFQAAPGPRSRPPPHPSPRPVSCHTAPDSCRVGPVNSRGPGLKGRPACLITLRLGPNACPGLKVHVLRCIQYGTFGTLHLTLAQHAPVVQRKPCPCPSNPPPSRRVCSESTHHPSERSCSSVRRRSFSSVPGQAVGVRRLHATIGTRLPLPWHRKP